MEGSIILVRHAMPELDEATAPKEWQLGETGLKQAKKIAHFVKDNLDVDPVIYSSNESKARDTAAIISEHLGLTHKENSKIGEFDLPALPIVGEEAYQNRSRPIFKNPSSQVLGEESAEKALERFETGIQEILKDPLEDERLIVTHGIVMSLFIEKYNEEMNGLDIWKKLECPSYAVLSLPDFKILELNGRPLKG